MVSNSLSQSVNTLDTLKNRKSLVTNSSNIDRNTHDITFGEINVDVSPTEKYSKNKVLGIDPILGDIIFEPHEYPIIRGGWRDRNDIYYSEAPLDGMSSINIDVRGFPNRKKVANR